MMMIDNNNDNDDNNEGCYVQLVASVGQRKHLSP